MIAVSAPAGGGPDATLDTQPPLFQGPAPQEDQEDIFSQGEEGGDDLFGEAAPRLELPREPTFTIPPSLEVLPQSARRCRSRRRWSRRPPAGQRRPVPPPVEPPPLAPDVSYPSGLTDGRKAKPPARMDWFFPLVFMPLILWAVGMTALAVFLYARLATEKPSLFDRMPDVDGDHPGVARTKLSLQFKKSEAAGDAAGRTCT